MKLQELGLAQKPQTKYFEGGFISFRTVEGVLHYKVTSVSKSKMGTIDNGIITAKDELDVLLSAKYLEDVI